MTFNNPIRKIEDTILNWVDRFQNPTGAGNALLDGIPKDPNYTPKKPFFENGESKNPPFSPNLKTPINETTPPLAPSQLFDPYLENIAGGKKALLEEIQTNYQRDKENLPWKQTPENRNRKIPIEITNDPDSGSHYRPNTHEIFIAPHRRPLNPAKEAYNGLTGHPTLLEEVLHELGHAATFDHTDNMGHFIDIQRTKQTLEDMETQNPRALKQPYQFALSEEYKVGALLFLNKSRQLTGEKLTNPQKIHQILDEVEKNPNIINKNFSNEEGRVLRTYLLLKETNPKGAEILRNALARDCQYLAKNGENRARASQAIGELQGPKTLSSDTLSLTAALSAPSPNKNIQNLQENLIKPIESWINSLQPEPNKKRDTAGHTIA